MANRLKYSKKKKKRSSSSPSALSAVRQKLRATQVRLEQLYEYKAIMKADGLPLNQSDKELESEFVLKKRYLTKELERLEQIAANAAAGRQGQISRSNSKKANLTQP